MDSILLADEEDAEIGPAMSALSDRWRRFVRALVNQGRSGRLNYGDAAKRAGFSDRSSGALRVQGHTLAHDPRIQAAVLEEAQRTVHLGAAVVATPVTISIALDKSLKAADRLRACEMLFNRGGMPALTEHKVTVEHTASNTKMLELARRLAAELGVDEARLIGVNRAAADAIEAEFTEVLLENPA